MSDTPRHIGTAPTSATDFYEERAAILEHDAADCYPTRAEAERRAEELTATLYRRTLRDFGEQ